MRFGLRLFLAAFIVATPALAAEPVIESFTLKNGMEVIVIENHRVPAISHMLWFHVGAGDDPELKSGLAHYHEHMMFQGTEHYQKGEYADIIARHGGQQNAFTGHDATAYYVNIEKENLPLVMQLEADRLRGLAPTDADASKEREVIIEERRLRIENNPEALFSEQMDAALFLHHPYHIPVIGWMHEMEGLTKQDVLEFHSKHYHPGNATLIVSGDITAAELKPLTEQYYAPIPAGPPLKREWKKEPPERAARRLSMHHPNVTQPQWERVYTAPSVQYDDSKFVPALSVLEQILGGGHTSRLHQALVVKQKIATDVNTSYDGLARGPGTFSVSATPAEGESLSAVEAAVDAQIGRIIKEGITEDELKRAKTLLKADIIYSREGLQSTAYMLGWLRMLDMSVEYFKSWPEMVESVTAEEVKKAAAHLFDLKHSVTGTLLPEAKDAE